MCVCVNVCMCECVCGQMFQFNYEHEFHLRTATGVHLSKSTIKYALSSAATEPPPPSPPPILLSCFSTIELDIQVRFPQNLPHTWRTIFIKPAAGVLLIMNRQTWKNRRTLSTWGVEAKLIHGSPVAMATITHRLVPELNAIILQRETFELGVEMPKLLKSPAVELAADRGVLTKVFDELVRGSGRRSRQENKPRVQPESSWTSLGV